MKQIMQKMNVKKVISVLLLLAVLLLSVNVISKKAGDPETHAKPYRRWMTRKRTS